MNKRFTQSSVSSLTRRQFGNGLIALGVLGTATPALAQSNVSVDKLMAKSDLPDITVGNKDAKVTIVEYASMSCPHCARFHKNVYPKLKEMYLDNGKALLVMREFPLNEIAVAVSMITRCAGTNDQIAALIDVYFEHQSEWLVRNAEAKLFELAQQAGFTKESFQKCLSDEKLYSNLLKQREVASKEFGVSRTPSFFINGKAVTGNIMNIDTFATIIDPLLKQNG